MRSVGIAIGICCLFLHPIYSVAQLNKQKPDNIQDVGVTEQLGTKVPLNLKFTNAKGNSITLGELLNNDKPILLNPVYYECPQLCTMVKDAIYNGVKDLKWNPGTDYNIVTFSFDPSESYELAAKNKEKYLNKLNRSGAEEGWYFLTGNKKNIQQLTETIGYDYNKLENGDFAHGAAIMFLSPDGTITRYLYGLKFNEFDMRNALYDAADGNIGSTAEQVLLYCYQYDANSNSYVPVAWRFMQIGGFATFIILGIFLSFMWMRHRNYTNEKQIKEPNGRA